MPAPLDSVARAATRKLRQATASWRTTIIGLVALLDGLAGLLGYVFGEEAVTVAGFSEHWDNILVGLIGVGLISAKDNLTKSEDVPK